MTAKQLKFDIPDFSAFNAAIQKFMEHWQSLQQSIEPLIKSLQKDFAELPDNTRKVQSHCADRGWYFLCREVPLDTIALLARMIDAKQYEKVEEVIKNFARSQVDNTLKKAGTHWPHRLGILKDAFEAHKQGLYTLSIPTLLAQADGVCYEILNVSLFGKKIKKALEQYLEKYKDLGKAVLSTEIANLLLDPLKTVSSIAVNTKDRDKRREEDFSYGPLNRHGVLHGIDIDYPKEANSLRAIMLVNYLTDVKHLLDTKAENTNEHKQS